MTVFRIALYSPAGDLLKASGAFPDGHTNPQVSADRAAKAADSGCTYEAGAFLVWADPAYQPPNRIEQCVNPDGRRDFGRS